MLYRDFKEKVQKIFSDAEKIKKVEKDVIFANPLKKIYPNGQVKEIIYFDSSYMNERSKVNKIVTRNKSFKPVKKEVIEKYHNDAGPAVIKFDETGQKLLEEYYICGKNITPKVKEWIIENNIPSPETWSNREKRLFKEKFGKPVNDSFWG